MPEFMTRKEVAAVLKCSEDAIRLWEREGKLRTVRVGRLVRIPSEEIDYLKRNGKLRENLVA